jgi:hypothetical protein
VRQDRPVAVGYRRRGANVRHAVASLSPHLTLTHRITPRAGRPDLCRRAASTRAQPRDAPSGATVRRHVARELRAVWIATVDNMDWPSKAGLPRGEQQRELLAILDSSCSSA